MPADPTTLTAAEIVGQGALLSTASLARALLARIDDREPVVEAWAHLDPKQVLAGAAVLDQAKIRGPLHGVPVGVKDVLLTRDMPTCYNSPAYIDARPAQDAAAVALLRAAGALIVGKTRTVEFASVGRPAETRNPHDPRRTPGGSSSGSAAAVADGHVPVALGTQTGGSMIRPASFCGVHALKPTWGVVSAEGAKVFSPTLDTIGWFARSVADLALLLDVFDPPASGERRSALDVRGVRIAICRSPVWDQAEDATIQAMARAETLLRAAGADVALLELPSPLDRLTQAHRVIMESEARASFLSEYRLYDAELHPNIRALVENVAGHTREDLRRAYDLAAHGREVFDRLADPFDAVLTPSTPGEAPLGLASTGAMTFNALWTLLHVPCVNLPAFWGPAGMPVGLTLTGPRFSDRRVLAAAAALDPVMTADA